MAAKLILVGNLGRDPEMRYTPSGQAVTNINIATNRQWNDSSGEKHKETTWFRVSFWGKTAEVVSQYFHKGQPIYVEGRLICDPATGGPRLWKRQDNSMAASFEVSGEHFEFVSGTGNGTGTAEAPEEEATEKTEEVPF